MMFVVAFLTTTAMPLSETSGEREQAAALTRPTLFLTSVYR